MTSLLPDTSSDPSPSPEPPTSSGPSLFLPPTPPPDPMSDPSPSPDLSSESPDTSPQPSDGSGSGSRARSTGSGKRKALRELAGAAALMAGVAAHRLLTRRNTPERDIGLYLPDQEDLDAISRPMAGLMSRRLPEGADNPDVSDGLGVVAALFGYLMKQLDKREQIAEAAEYAAPMPHAADPEEVAL